MVAMHNKDTREGTEIEVNVAEVKIIRFSKVGENVDTVAIIEHTMFVSETITSHGILLCRNFPTFLPLNKERNPVVNLPEPSWCFVQKLEGL